jgi:hypothetical protein
MLVITGTGNEHHDDHGLEGGEFEAKRSSLLNWDVAIALAMTWAFGFLLSC